MSSPVHYPESSPTRKPREKFSPSSRDRERQTKRKRVDTELISQTDPIGQDNEREEILSGMENLRNAQIWGTDINVTECMSKFERFLKEFKTDEQSNSPKYKELFEDIEETQNYVLLLDTADLYSFDSGLYRQLISYPQEVLPLFDSVANREYSSVCPEDPSSYQIQVRTYNLQKTIQMSDIDPDDIDSLLSVVAMVTRVSVVIPDLKSGHFRCSRCLHETEVEIDRGRVNQPRVCENTSCRTKDSYFLIHNRSLFMDKQLVRVQETPESIPEGETPQTVDVFCYGDLIDSVRPGDRVKITGVYRAVPIRVNQQRRQIKALYRGYIDAIHFQKLSKSLTIEVGRGNTQDEGSKAADEDNSKDGQDAVDKTRRPSSRTGVQVIEEQRLREMANDPEIYQKLVNSIAPSIWELEDVKKGILCQLFGGVKKTRLNESSLRSEINVLLCGDPGTSKSQLLQYVHKLSTRGIYTSGKGSSAVGLTASVARDPETRETVLESGALVLSDRGICCIDEFDKMSDSARSILHEVMEQQTISIAKAGIICSLNARTSILAAANPKESRYDCGLSVVDNIRLPPTLLSRFDLIYIVLDKPNERLDRRLAQHLVSLYSLEKEQTPNDFFDLETLTAYIALAKRTVQPKITDEAATGLIKGYLDMRKRGRYGNKKVIAATPRQLESLIRISEALARMRFSEEVSPSDVEEAIRLMKVATQSAATDPKTGFINIDLITVGQGAFERRESQKKIDLMLEIIDSTSNGKPLTFFMKAFNSRSDKKLNFAEFKELLKALEEKQYIFCKNWKKKDPVIYRVEG